MVNLKYYISDGGSNKVEIELITPKEREAAAAAAAAAAASTILATHLPVVNIWFKKKSAHTQSCNLPYSNRIPTLIASQLK